jgi:phosphoribosylformylglycinamidine synthase
MKKFAAKVNITLRSGILDVQGKTVEHALHSLEYNSLSNIRIGKFVELTVEAENEEKALETVNNACKQLIANPIIEDHFVTLEEIK